MGDIMKRPSVYILAYLLAGIIFGQHFTDIKYAIIFMSAVIIVTGIICFLSKIWKCSFLILILVTGIFVGYKSTMPKDINLYSIAQNNVKADIRCEVLDLSKDYGGNLYKYIVSAEHIENEKVNSDIYGKAILYTGANLNSGDVIIINGKIRPIEKKKNKTDFDSYSYYKSYGIEYKISITDLSEISHRTNFNSIVKAIRNKFANNFDLILPQDKASFMKAIILGDRADLDEELYQTFKDGGVAHIVVISGLHISIIAGFILCILGRYGRNLSFAVVITFLFFYCVMTGLSPSVLRAALMMVILIVGRIIGREYDLISSTAVACIVLMVINPYNIYNIGFQYTFMCVFGIGMAMDIINRYKIYDSKYYKIVSMIMISVTACLFSKPITLYNFYYINTWDVISSIFIVPLMSFVIGFGIAANFLTFISIGMGKVTAFVPSIIIDYYESVCNIVMRIPYYKLETGGILETTLCAVYMFYFVIYHSFMDFKNIKYLLIPTVILSTMYLQPYDRVSYINTDNAQCIVIIEEDNCTLINCGSKNRANLGNYRILNYLRYRNVDDIDCIYVTKSNYNYMGGVLEICRNIKIDKICISNSCEKNKMYKRLLAAAEENNIKVEHY